MGLFSWMTCDTNRSIPCLYSCRPLFPVFVLCPDGTKIEEKVYEGYGEFGGRDIYQLVAEWNCPEECDGDVEHDRCVGIRIACDDADNARLKFPIKIAENADSKYDNMPPSKGCPHQGYFYDYEDEYYC